MIKLIITPASVVDTVLRYEGTRQKLIERAKALIGHKRVYFGNDGVETICNVSGQYGWSKVCRYKTGDKFDAARGAKLALLRALGLKGGE